MMSNAPAITIHRAAPGDVGTILHFISKLAEYEKLSHQMHATQELLREHLFGPHPAAEAILAKISGTPVGFALFFQTFSTFVGKPGIWLEDLFVLPEHRKNGVGRELFRYVAALAVERDCGRLEWSALDWNEPAIRFYLKLGSVAMDDWTTYRLVGDDLRKAAQSSK
jgi:GNAT superfamily N-acetyltransferase